MKCKKEPEKVRYRLFFCAQNRNMDKKYLKKYVKTIDM